jgi:hypothetical protein
MTMKVFHLFKRQITKNKFKIQKPNKKNNWLCFHNQLFLFYNINNR